MFVKCLLGPCATVKHLSIVICIWTMKCLQPQRERERERESGYFVPCWELVGHCFRVSCTFQRSFGHFDEILWIFMIWIFLFSQKRIDIHSILSLEVCACGMTHCVFEFILSFFWSSSPCFMSPLSLFLAIKWQKVQSTGISNYIFTLSVENVICACPKLADTIIKLSVRFFTVLLCSFLGVLGGC